MSDKTLQPNLRLVAMPSEPDLALAKARTAWWLRVCRMLDPRKPTLAQVAKAADLQEGSGSVVSLWENNRTANGPTLPQLRRLAAFYGVPLTLFTESPETDEERLATIRRLALGAVDLEQQDWESEAAGHLAAAAEPAAKPGRRTA